MTSSLFPESDDYIGWLRVGGRGKWHQVCRGKTQSECWRLLLLTKVASGCTVVDKVVMRSTEDPNKAKRPR